jgi:hypothetical protein
MKFCKITVFYLQKVYLLKANPQASYRTLLLTDVYFFAVPVVRFRQRATVPIRIFTKYHHLHKLGTMTLAKERGAGGMLRDYRYCRMMADGKLLYTKLISVTSQKSLQNYNHAELKKKTDFQEITLTN